jgi:hypothetical protein
MFIFNLNVVFTTHVLKVVPIGVRFSLGFPPGGGFHGEEFAPAGSADQPNCTHITGSSP